MKSFKMAVAGLRRDLVQQGLTPIYPGQPVPSAPAPLLERGPLIGRIARDYEDARAWVRRFQVSGRPVHVTALRSGFLVFVRAA